MKKTIIAAAAVCVATLLLTGCTAEAAGTIADGAPSSASKTPPASKPAPPAPAPTVTVTVPPTSEPTAAPRPAPHAGEAYATPTLSSADAIKECLAAHERSNFTSTITGEKYAFLTHDGGWWVVLEGENKYGALIGDCKVGGTPNEWQTEVGYGETDVAYFTPALVDSVVNGKGGL